VVIDKFRDDAIGTGIAIPSRTGRATGPEPLE
jgi:hypothetical protein